MHTSSKKRFDFFTEYHKEKLSKITSYLFSGVFAVFLAFSFVSYSQNNDLGGLMASVSNLTTTEQSKQYDADLILQKSGNTFSVVFGSDAKKVDSIGLTILTNPPHFGRVESEDPDTNIMDLGSGIFRITKTLNSQDILAGSVVIQFGAEMDKGTFINLVDTEFMSEGVKYSLTNKSEQ